METSKYIEQLIYSLVNEYQYIGPTLNTQGHVSITWQSKSVNTITDPFSISA